MNHTDLTNWIDRTAESLGLEEIHVTAHLKSGRAVTGTLNTTYGTRQLSIEIGDSIIDSSQITELALHENPE